MSFFLNGILRYYIKDQKSISMLEIQQCSHATPSLLDGNLSLFPCDSGICMYFIYMGMLSHLSHVWLFVTLWTVACRVTLSMGFSKQEYWSGLPCPPLGDFSNPGMESSSLTSPSLAGGFFTTGATWEDPHVYILRGCYLLRPHKVSLNLFSILNLCREVEVQKGMV